MKDFLIAKLGMESAYNFEKLVPLCTIKIVEDGILEAEKEFLVLLTDKRFEDFAELHIARPYIFTEDIDGTPNITFGWVMKQFTRPVTNQYNPVWVNEDVTIKAFMELPKGIND